MCRPSLGSVEKMDSGNVVRDEKVFRLVVKRLAADVSGLPVPVRGCRVSTEKWMVSTATDV